ncbi:MAG: thiol oxidoreductase [Chloroflexi bacterium]|nr:thiol oxidoreductase [Chloroflexota bacterium]
MLRLRGIFLIAGLALCAAGLTLAQDGHSRTLLGGRSTVFNDTPNAFGFPSPALSRDERLLFAVGNSFFRQNWAPAPSTTQSRDGLGPFYTARSCAGCHFKDGRGRLPVYDSEAPTGMLTILSQPERRLTGGYAGDPVYGGLLHTGALEGIAPEGSTRITYEEIPGQYADGTPYTLRRPIVSVADLAYGDLHPDTVVTVRVATQLIGLGLLEAVPEETILALADPTDADGDGVSGRPNWVWDILNNQRTLGRFGWKAGQPSLLQEVALAYAGEIGVTNSLASAEDYGPMQVGRTVAEDRGLEISDDNLLKVVLYTQTLAVPAQRNADDPQVQRGYALFFEAQCHTCHVPALTTSIHPEVPALSNQTIYPYTDLLLHDMGEGLADGMPEFEASAREWRTSPLWGIGLFETVSGHTTYLHDGRARDLAEAILWHGGEAEFSAEAFRAMNADDRAALIALMESF